MSVTKYDTAILYNNNDDIWQIVQSKKPTNRHYNIFWKISFVSVRHHINKCFPLLIIDKNNKINVSPVCMWEFRVRLCVWTILSSGRGLDTTRIIAIVCHYMTPLTLWSCKVSKKEIHLLKCSECSTFVTDSFFHTFNCMLYLWFTNKTDGVDHHLTFVVL